MPLSPSVESALTDFLDTIQLAFNMSKANRGVPTKLTPRVRDSFLTARAGVLKTLQAAWSAEMTKALNALLERVNLEAVGQSDGTDEVFVNDAPDCSFDRVFDSREAECPELWVRLEVMDPTHNDYFYNFPVTPDGIRRCIEAAQVEAKRLGVAKAA